VRPPLIENKRKIEQAAKEAANTNAGNDADVECEKEQTAIALAAESDTPVVENSSKRPHTSTETMSSAISSKKGSYQLEFINT
jgi:activator of HSP90 ATPase